ncbi:MAG: hypothetical protein Q9174_004892 [Haloplaca sp. 1 TL-2023]
MSWSTRFTAVNSSTHDDAVEQNAPLLPKPPKRGHSDANAAEASSTLLAETSWKRVKVEDDDDDAGVRVKREDYGSPLDGLTAGLATHHPSIPAASSTQTPAAVASTTIAPGTNANANASGFPCTFPGCTRVLTRKTNMKQHLNTHTQAKPIICKCAGCGEGFNAYSGKYRHQKMCDMRPEAVQKRAQQNERQAGDNQDGTQQNEDKAGDDQKSAEEK